MICDYIMNSPVCNRFLFSFFLALTFWRGKIIYPAHFSYYNKQSIIHSGEFTSFCFVNFALFCGKQKNKSFSKRARVQTKKAISIDQVL